MKSRIRSCAVAALGIVSFAGHARGQGTPFRTPGMPRVSDPLASGEPASGQEAGQSSRFSNVFNPAFSFIVDAVGSHRWSDAPPGRGFDGELRTLELAAQSWVDPNAWAYFVVASEEAGLAVEEAAVHYVGLGERSTLRGGRFFIDFGKQMQAHVHELRTTERPLVLRAYLGDEVKGDGMQVDHWEGVGEAAVVRGSLGVFADLLPEEQEFLDEAFERQALERKEADELSAAARLTGFSDVGANGVLQLGASARWIPDFTVVGEADGLESEGFASRVYGFDATYGHTDDIGLRKLTLGGEALWSRGDSGFGFVDPDAVPDSGDESIASFDEDLFGFYGFVDYAWSAYQSAGIQYSDAELARAGAPHASEWELYYTLQLSEFQRLRFTLSHLDPQGGEDATLLLVQYTAFVGSHGHGLNW